MERKRIFAISGVKNSGKTTLICRLLEIFKDKGLKVAVLKHDGHDFVPDVPGTDTYCQLQSGAYGTAVFSAGKYMLVKQQPQISEKELAEFFPEAGTGSSVHCALAHPQEVVTLDRKSVV